MSSGNLALGRSVAGKDVELPLIMANRHGLIAGATGTGKTVSLQTMAEGFARSGVPVFMTDVKGDLSGLAAEGRGHPKIAERVALLGLDDYRPRSAPVVFWDLLGVKGHPVRTTVSDMGPLLLSHLLELNETQSGVLYACFRIADDEGLLLLDLKDLQAMLAWMGENRSALGSRYGNIASASIGAIQRRLLMLESEGAAQFFGEPALQMADLMQRDFSGNGVISVLDATALMTRPRLYSTFLLWLLSELFEQLPEVGDKAEPRLVFFFDEAHLLFDRAPRALLDKVEQVVRLIRSKGVGIYFVSQSPGDIPQDILGQLGHRVQHALRAFTPKDRKVVKAAAQTFRAAAGVDTEKLITSLGVGEALVSVLDVSGVPTEVAHTLMRPPESRLGPLEDAERAQLLSRSPMGERYDQMVDRESAFELLKARSEKALQHEVETQGDASAEEKKPRSQTGRASSGLFGSLAKSAMRAIGTQLGRQIVRGLLGSILGGRR
uniref:helicase HerA-like domain-containing protein n=1 Tax=Marinobacterium profundum TaxID=1714300 RepID=UPI00082AEBFB|nr:helicase HerA-like domain-containing protein [Marinobacterium profundum]